VALLVGAGVFIGAGASLWASRFVASLVYGLAPRDPVTLIGAVITLILVGAVAAGCPRGERLNSIPRRRSERADPPRQAGFKRNLPVQVPEIWSRRVLPGAPFWRDSARSLGDPQVPAII
jgi:hypothetical protein